MSHANIHPWLRAATFLVLVGACGPAPTYSRVGASGGEPGVEDPRDAGSGGANSGGTGAGGFVSTGGRDAGGLAGAGGRSDSDTGGRGAGGTGGSVASTGGQGIGGTGGALVATGGAPVATGGAGSVAGGSGGAHSGGSPASTGGAATGGRGGALAGSGGGGSAGGGATAPPDLSKYGFETSVQGWGAASGSGTWTSIDRCSCLSFAGAGSLAGSLSAQSGVAYILEVAPPMPAIPAGAVVTFHVRVPTAAMLTAVQAYVMETGTYRYTSARVMGSELVKNTWIKIDVNVPKDAAAILRLGVQFESSGAWSDTVYLDAIDW